MLVPETMSQKFRGAQVALLQNSADPSTCAPQSFGPLNLCPAEFWSNATCAPRSFGDIISGPKKPQK